MKNLAAILAYRSYGMLRSKGLIWPGSSPFMYPSFSETEAAKVVEHQLLATGRHGVQKPGIIIQP
jgi:hypothetical protein